MNFDETSNKEINRKVTIIVEGFGKYNFLDNGTYSKTTEFGFEVAKVEDYCTNPLQAWPIIMNNKIDIEWFSEFGTATSKLCKRFETVKFINPEHALKAAMIVFLKINEEKQNDSTK